MTEIKVVVVDAGELRRIVTEAMHEAAAGRLRADDWVDGRSSGMARRTFLRLAREGAFPASKRGRTYVARRADVDAYLERQRIQPAIPEPRETPPPACEAIARTDVNDDPVARALAAGRLRVMRKPG